MLSAFVATAHADLRVAIANDALVPEFPMDDDGFTNDLDLRFWRPFHSYQLGGRAYHRWITEVPREEGRRRDLFELVATLGRTWSTVTSDERPRAQLVVDGRAGLVLTGNVGGRWIQDQFHGLCRCGDRLDEGLQDTYAEGRDAGAMAGARARGSVRMRGVEPYGVVDAQAAAGAGVTWLDVGAGTRFAVRVGHTELSAHAELALVRFHTSDRGSPFAGATARDGRVPTASERRSSGAATAWSTSTERTRGRPASPSAYSPSR